MANILGATQAHYFTSISERFDNFIPFFQQLLRVERVQRAGTSYFDVLVVNGLMPTIDHATCKLRTQLIDFNPSVTNTPFFYRRSTSADTFGLQLSIPADVEPNLGPTFTNELARYFVASFEETLYSIMYQAAVGGGPDVNTQAPGHAHGTQPILTTPSGDKQLINYNGSTPRLARQSLVDGVQTSTVSALSRAAILGVRDLVLSRVTGTVTPRMYMMIDPIGYTKIVNASPTEIRYIQVTPGKVVMSLHNILIFPALGVPTDRAIIFTAAAMGCALSSLEGPLDRILSEAGALAIGFFFRAGAAILREKEIQIINYAGA